MTTTLNTSCSEKTIVLVGKARGFCMYFLVSIVHTVFKASAFFKDSSVVGQNCQMAHQGRS
jgi:hypothetical protein